MPNPTFLSQYRLDSLVGRGAFAEVYRATHLELKTIRAIKLLRRDAPGLGSRDFEECRERFRFEAQLGARIKHPNLLLVYDFFQEEDTLALVMEYAAGGTLGERIEQMQKKDSQLPFEQVLQWTVEIAGGLSALHALGAVHRDLKPSNILFDENDHAKVADLGLAQIPGGPSQRSLLSQPQPHPGTPGYMSPEQESSRQYLTPASDIYALGCILFEMLTGRVYRSLRPGTRAVTLRPDLPPWVDELLGRMLASRPDERPWDGTELLKLLSNYQAAAPTQPPPAAQAQPITAQPSRGWLVGGMILLAVLIMLGINAWQRFFPSAAPHFPTPTLPAAPTITAAVAPPSPSATSAPSPVPLATDTPVPFPPVCENTGQQWNSPLDGMPLVCVPAGEFSMGTDGIEGESPQHTVSLSAFWIDQWEVTNAMFAAFVQATGYQTQAEALGNAWGFDGSWRDVPGADWRHPDGPSSSIAGLEHHPVVQVSWFDAQAYCQWAGRQLPSEAQWEKAARGPDGRSYPWGNTFDCHLANTDDETQIDISYVAGGGSCDGFDRTAPVGSFPGGASPYNALDMAGNVLEWVADWYDSNYYSLSPSLDPTGPENGTQRSLRNGSWYTSEGTVRTAQRSRAEPTARLNTLGFRCAYTP